MLEDSEADSELAHPAAHASHVAAHFCSDAQTPPTVKPFAGEEDNLDIGIAHFVRLKLDKFSASHPTNQNPDAF